ncbi:MAG: tyrosine-type recombinase/integrase [Thermoproteota archaeon]
MEYIEVLESWMEVRGLTDYSKKLYRWVSEDFLRFCRSRGLAVDKNAVKEYLASLNISPGNKQWRWRILKRCFEVWGLEWFSNIEEAYIRPKPQERVSRPFLTIQEFMKLYEVADKDWVRLALRIVAETGARRIQVAILMREHFNPDKRTLYIPPVKRSLERVEVLSGELTRNLSEYLKNRLDDDEHLLVDENGRPITLHKMNNEFRRLKKKTGINVKGLGFHGLRRSWATWLYERGMREREIQEAGGWKSMSMVSIYTRLSAPASVRKELELHPLKGQE